MRGLHGLPDTYRGKHELKYSELTEQLIGVFFSVYNELGHGFLESVYEEAFSVALVERQLFFERQIGVPVWYDGRKVGDFRADLLVDRKIIIELKTGRDIEFSWEKQLLNYLRATEIEVGLLLNFGPSAQFRRLVFANERKISAKSAFIRAKKKLQAAAQDLPGEAIDQARSE